ncbi:glycosyltransferase family 2 protein [Rhizomonospora bruguierae]|uniref:glycosyltransferase family 2 protein n=1 Tax=Rhizomonospora bruguierae TaxID=1581705 RepID=UPI001BCBD4E5|nr:glycosyltransferase family 2 protein [Micromonospora sp. NBRC 107566]
MSVICPTWNRSAAIRSTIDSVLAQTRADLEMLVISDGCTDDTEAAVLAASNDDHRVRLHRIEHSGHPSRAMNAGLAAASGEVIAYIDHDDRWAPDHLATLLPLLDDGADIAAAGSTWVDAEGALISERPAASLFWHPEIQVINPVFENSQAVHRAELLTRAGPWRVAPHGLEDWDMWLRMTDLGARFRTTVHRTVFKTMAWANRHRRLPKAHGLVLASFPDVGSARRGLAALSQPAAAEELARAGHSDRLQWYRHLAETVEFVFPIGFAGDRSAATAAVPAALAQAQEADRGLEDPVTVRLKPSTNNDRRVELVQDINCMTTEHAERYQAVTLRAYSRFFAIVEQVTAPFGGALPNGRNN